MVRADFLIRNAREILSCAGRGPMAGPRQSQVSAIADASLAALDGSIVFVGPAAAAAAHVTLLPDAVVLDAEDHAVVPGFVDAHTHAVFAGDRRAELRRRLAGATYAEIAAAGGGIVSTVQATREATEEELVAQSRPRLDEMLASGTTTCEIKSGYGLDVASELRMLRAIASLDRLHAIDVVPTFMGAHEVPPEYRNRRAEYVQLVIEEMIPAVAAEKLATWCDVFCETGVFSPEESQRILHAGMQHGLKARIHADELGASGGSRVAAQVGARSADHLIFVPDDGIAALASAGVVATLLPNAAFYLKLGRFAPARTLIAAGVPVALATDVNPGGGFSPSMPFAIALACFGMNMTFEEALVAATSNGAWSLDIGDRVGSLEPGKLADAVIVRGEAINLIRMGAPSIAHVVKRGRIVAH
ncbi:MAG: imidazolonepropionase [Acidobacteriota bacterium]|nr:imidazolonepropionase [Acidobacteriota bacterium]